MRILIVGIGALGGTIAARGIRAGMKVSLAARTIESAKKLLTSGLKVSGVGGDIAVYPTDVATLEEYTDGEKFDLILLATKAQEALKLAPQLVKLLNSKGTLLPIQNGGVSQLLADKLGKDIVLGGLSHLGATMIEAGVYKQSNAGHITMGEISGGESERAKQISQELQKAIGIKVTANMPGAIWSKLLLNCSVTTLGAVAGQSMRQYHSTPVGKEIFRKIYDETLSVAIAIGTTLEKMIVNPIPPNWKQESKPGSKYNGWIEEVLSFYGDLKASMLQDFERGRLTEIDFINGYVAQVGARRGVSVPLNTATQRVVHRIEQGKAYPHPALLEEILATR